MISSRLPPGAYPLWTPSVVAFASSADDVELAIVEFEAVEELEMANEDEELEIWVDDELEVPGLGLGVAVVWG